MTNSEKNTLIVEQVAGDYLPQFQHLADTFKNNFTQLNETGAGLCVYYQGKVAVNLYGSHHSVNGHWKPQDRVCTMSASKAPLALCLHLLAEREKLSFTDKVSKYWPEFSQNGKGEVTVYQLLNHTAGLAIVRNCKSGDIFNWSSMVKALEQAPLISTPGEVLTYHALTFGHLIGELIRRIDGRMPSDFFHQEISMPFNIAYDLRYLTEHNIRPIVVQPQFNKLPLWLFSKVLPLIPHWKMQYFRPCDTNYHPNSLAWQHSEIPAVTGQGSASGLAKLYAFLAHDGQLDGQRLCSEETINNIQHTSFDAIEQASKQHWHMGLGFLLNSPELVAFGPNSTSFGHVGMGGATGFCDPDNKLSFAYVTERYHQPNKDDKSMAGKRLQHLIKACYDSL